MALEFVVIVPFKLPVDIREINIVFNCSKRRTDIPVCLSVWLFVCYPILVSSFGNKPCVEVQ
jgi:hypothetical protein